jgi:predicted AlkP superfamily pyrophosphatase or phosphodiesterase
MMDDLSIATNATIAFVDAFIVQMITAINPDGLGRKTLVIISAKHGQPPIDVTKRKGWMTVP